MSAPKYHDLGIRPFTVNQQPQEGYRIEGHGLKTRTVPIIVPPNHNLHYLETKQNKWGICWNFPDRE
jgi:GTP cyclohydrolase II